MGGTAELTLSSLCRKDRDESFLFSGTFNRRDGYAENR